MSRYIDIDDLPTGRVEWDDIFDAPSIDIVRCSECKYNPKGMGWVSCPMTGANTRKPDDFCSYGERKSDGKDIQSADER